jgi:tetratricopeptide (TPR) repeat protein
MSTNLASTTPKLTGRPATTNSAPTGGPVNDFANELSRIEEAISSLEAETSPLSIEKTTRFLYGLFRRASLTNREVDFKQTERAIEDAIRKIGPCPDICFLKASLDLKLHRLGKAKAALQLAPGLASSASAKVLQADIDFQEGRYAAAGVRLEDAVEKDRSWDSLARLAYFHWKMGHEALAERLYLESEDEITAKEPRAFAWVELQRGRLDFSRGRYQKTRVHYNRAAQSYTGYWLVDEHVAELLAAEGNYQAAIALLQSIVDRATKPELKQAIGELYLLMGQPEQAEPWLESAMQDYLESAERGDVHYYHHLTDFYCCVRDNPKSGVDWALRDVELRPNFSSQAGLAWALYRDNRIDAAVDLVDLALASGVRDARLYHQAGIIYRAAGRTAEGEKLIERAGQMNPRYEDFHIHH